MTWSDDTATVDWAPLHDVSLSTPDHENFLFSGERLQMPTYEYECEKCGLIFEEFQRISEPPLTVCRKDGCGGNVRRLISPGAGFLFKGSGFYSTDYRSESYKKQAKSDAAPSSTSTSAPDSGKKGTDKPKSDKAAK
jgi:putative FmdB family regulatory protein